MSTKKSITVRFEHSNEQQLGKITKVVGLVRAKSIIDIIDYLDLDANPRNSKTGPVTDAIQDSIRTDSELFPFKTKGILLAASSYERLERHRYKISIVNTALEGILDGGHNTLAIGLYILQEAFEYANEPFPRGNKTWDIFKELWNDNHDLIDEYRLAIKSQGDVDTPGPLDFYVPVELLLPSDPDDFDCVETFNANLLNINQARNNNVQLVLSAVANQKGYFEDLKSIMEKHNKDLYERIEWKTNAGGEVKVEDVVALTWIPLSLLEPVTDSDGKRVDPPVATKIYSGKALALKSFERFMSSPEVTTDTADYRAELKNSAVVSAFHIAAELPELYDYIYEKLPELYNAADGKYGLITAVKALNERRHVKKTPYLGKEIKTLSPDGFVAPLVYGLYALMEVHGSGKDARVVWKTDPWAFLEKNLPAIVARYKEVFSPWNYDPQKIGKAISSYNQVVDLYKMAYAGIL